MTVRDLKIGSRPFSLVEILVVVFIVAVLAAAAFPVYHSKIDKAKWSEGRVMMGTIATAIRCWCAEHTNDFAGPRPGTLGELGFLPGECTGSFFSDADFSAIDITSINPPMFTIVCSPNTLPDRPSTPSSVTLSANADGSVVWTESL